MIKLWHHLDISTANAVSSNFVYPKKLYGGKGINWKYSPDQVFDENWWDYFSKRVGFKVDPVIILFFCDANNTNPYAHVDINEKVDPIKPINCAFNFTIGGAGSNMVWYNQEGFNESDLWFGETSEDWKLTNPNRRAPGAAIWRVDTLSEIARHHVAEDHITLVNTYWAHHIQMGNEDRWCFSIRPAYNEQEFTYEEYVDKVKKYIVDDDYFR